MGGVSVREKRGRLYLETRTGGRKVWERLGLSISGDPALDKEARAIAESARAMREAQLASGEWGLLDPVLSRLSIEEMAEIVARDKHKDSHVPKAVRYIKAFSRGTRIGLIDERWIERFRAFIIAQPTLSDTTKANYFGGLKTVMREAHRLRAILRNPCEYAHGLPVPDPEKVWLEEDELARLSACTPAGGEYSEQMRRGFVFACYTGLRVSDVQRLTWGRISRGERPKLLTRQKKTGDMVGVDLHPEAWRQIRDDTIHGREELVFPALSRSKTSPTQYFRMWEKKAGIEKKIGWHTARHTFAVRILEAGADLYTLSKLLGHRSIKSTEVYAKIVSRTKSAAIAALPDLVAAGKA